MKKRAYYHLPGLFEFYELYRVFLPLFREHREYFYDWCEIGSIYGAPSDCIWGGGRTSFGEADAEKVLEIIEEFAGVLPFDDKASPEVIRREFGLSKNAFKRAVGHLLKEGKIQIKDRRIYLVK